MRLQLLFLRDDVLVRTRSLVARLVDLLDVLLLAVVSVGYLLFQSVDAVSFRQLSVGVWCETQSRPVHSTLEIAMNIRPVFD